MALLVNKTDFSTSSVEKTANIKLPKDPKMWNQEILRHIFDTNDWIDADNYRVVWSSRFDGEKGYGTGVVVLEKEGKEVSIPVVVTEFNLEPLDILYFDNALRPLTKKTMEQAFHNTDIAGKLVKKDSTATSLFNTIFPPHWGRYIHASADPKMLCKEIDILASDLHEVSGRIKQAAPLVHGRPHFVSYLRDVMRRDDAISDDTIEPMSKISGVVIAQDFERGYKVGYLKDEVYLEKRAGYAETHEFIKEAFGYNKDEIDRLIDEVEARGIVSLNAGGQSKVAAMTEREIGAAKVEPIEDDSLVITQTTSGRPIEGVVIPATYSFDTKRMTPEKLLIDKERNILASGETIVGIRKGKAPIHQIINSTRVQYPRPGMIISFAWRNTSGIAAGGQGGQNIFLATQPVKLLGVEEIENAGTVYNVLTPYGGRKRVIILKKNQRPVFNENNEHQAIYLPETTVLLLGQGNMGNLVDSPESFKQAMVKEARCIQLSRLKETGEIMVKTAEHTYSCSADEVRSRLVSEGIDLAKVDQAIKAASILGSQKLFVDRAEMEKVAHASETELERLVHDIRSISAERDLVKVAMETGDVDTLDKVLSLNFVNRRNLLIFFKMLPAFKEAVQNLARLLLSARLGKVGVSAEAVADAMHSLQALIEKMEGFQIDRID